MNRSNAGHVLAVSLAGCALAATLALFNTYTEPPHPYVPWLAWAICACYAGLMALAVTTFERVRLPRWRGKARAQPVATGETQPKAQGPTHDRAAGDPSAWESLPLMAVPAVGRNLRDAVLAFARQYGMNAYEADRGYVLADAQGQCYRVAAA